MNVRVCNRARCDAPLRATKELITFSNPALNIRVYICPKCGRKTNWLADPNLDGSFGEVHKVKDKENGFSSASMLSDRRFFPPIPARVSNGLECDEDSCSFQYVCKTSCVR